LRWCPECRQLSDGAGHRCAANGPQLIEKWQIACDRCGDRFRDLTDRPYFDRYFLLAVAGHCPRHGSFHKSPDWRDCEIQQRADARRAELPLRDGDFAVEGGNKSIQLLRRNISSYLDLFSGRQLIFLSEVIRQLPQDDPTLHLNLALLVSTALEFNSMLCGYKGGDKRRAGAVRHTFAYHGYSFPYTALENNPLYPGRASGTLQKLFNSRIARGIHWANEPLERVLDDPQPRFIAVAGERDFGEEVDSAAALHEGKRRFTLWQGSAANLPVLSGSVDAVVTDPPYYDSIQYDDLSAFFRVWLRRFLPDAAAWAYDSSSAAVGSERDAADGRYQQLMIAIFGECRRVLRPDNGRLIFTFHHWQPSAWAALTIALYQAKFRLINRYVVHAEHLMSVHISKLKALTHDAILVLAPASENGLSHWNCPPKPDRADSYRFTEGCASFLGWLLDQRELSDGEIGRQWARALSGNGDAL
jgi:putative DNA methylase